MTNSQKFDTLKLKPALERNLDSLGYKTMTPVQQASLPLMLAGKDVVAQANTGSGKTAAFGLCCLNRISARSFTTQVLILCPTRELAEQVAQEMRRLARGIPNVKVLSLCGGAPLRNQTASLKVTPHIVVGTPGRIHKHLRAGNLALSTLQTFVLDEADRMLDMGFSDELDAILGYLPSTRQSLLFSATFPDTISSISQKIQRQAELVDVTQDEAAVQIAQIWCPAERVTRMADLETAIYVWGAASNIVFCNTKLDCNEVAAHLKVNGIAALALHGDLDQAERNEVLVRFANRSSSVLVATDVAARGLHIEDVGSVFNYELPKQLEVYVHRIGRTARAGKSGKAISLVEPREAWRLEEIKKRFPDSDLHESSIPENLSANKSLAPRFTTLQISGGRKNKLRPGDILGALTASGGIPGDAVGKIDLFDYTTYVAIGSDHVRVALRQINGQPIKGKKFRVRVRT